MSRFVNKGRRLVRLKWCAPESNDRAGHGSVKPLGWVVSLKSPRCQTLQKRPSRRSAFRRHRRFGASPKPTLGQRHRLRRNSGPMSE